MGFRVSRVAALVALPALLLLSAEASPDATARRFGFAPPPSAIVPSALRPYHTHAQRVKEPSSRLLAQQAAPAGEPRNVLALLHRSRRGGAAAKQQGGDGGGLSRFFVKNFLLMGMAAGIALAALNPQIGRMGGPLKPEFTVNTLGVCGIFFVTGLGLKFGDLAAALLNLPLNGAIQVMNLGVIPFLVAALRPLWLATGLKQELVDGMVMVNSLPCTINMAIVMTAAAGASLATAVFNCVLSNFLGIFITPLLILKFMAGVPTTGPAIKYADVVRKLFTKVVLPVAAGQGARLLSKRVREVVDTNPTAKLALKLTSEAILVSIIYTTFCDSFIKGLGLRGADLALLGLVVPSLHVALLGLSLAAMRAVGAKRDQQVAGMFVASHKTFAFGIPLIKTMFEGSPSVGLYSAPLLLLHPTQLVIGTLLAPLLSKYIKQQPGGGGEQQKTAPQQA